MVAIEAPLTQGTYSKTAKIDWQTIDELRAALLEGGFDWEAATKERIAVDNRRAKEYAERHYRKV